jgi:hypothetical protein
MVAAALGGYPSAVKVLRVLHCLLISWLSRVNFAFILGWLTPRNTTADTRLCARWVMTAS